PPSSPPVIRSSAISRCELLDPLVPEAPACLVEEWPDPRSLERAEAIAQLHDPPASLQEQRHVLRQRRPPEAGQAMLARPADLALASDRQVDLGEGEAAPLSGNRVEPRLRGLRLGIPEEDAERLVRAAADAAAQLVQLREPEALSALDQHHRGV